MATAPKLRARDRIKCQEVGVIGDLIATREHSRVALVMASSEDLAQDTRKSGNSESRSDTATNTNLPRAQGIRYQ